MDSQPVTPDAPTPFAVPANDAIRRILPPDPGRIFALRAARLRSLAHGHSLGDWLVFLSDLAEAQQYAADNLPPATPPSAQALAQARLHALPPLTGTCRPERAAWQRALELIDSTLRPHAPPKVQAALEALMNAPQRFDALALALLNGQATENSESDALPAAALLPLVAAALQVVWTVHAAQIAPEQIGDGAPAELCPCCGQPPVASLVRLDEQQVNNLRYLHCALCNTAWNRARAICTACGNEAQVAYRQIEGSNGAVRAETCDACGSYLKIVYQEQDIAVDPVADDLATLALDLLLDEAGYARSGPNYLLAGAAA